MITNFEEITYELTEEEKNLLEILISGFNRHEKHNPINELDIIRAVNSKRIELKLSNKLTGARLRKMVNFIRRNSLIPLIATSNGYFVSSDIEEIRKQVKSLDERASSIKDAANGLRKFII